MWPAMATLRRRWCVYSGWLFWSRIHECTFTLRFLGIILLERSQTWGFCMSYWVSICFRHLIRSSVIKMYWSLEFPWFRNLKNKKIKKKTQILVSHFKKILQKHIYICSLRKQNVLIFSMKAECSKNAIYFLTAINAKVTTVLGSIPACILRHSGIWGTVDEAVLNKVH